MGDKLHNHWSNGMIDKSFLAYYFPYLARNNFENLSPNEPISGKDFKLATASLLSGYGYEATALTEMHPFMRRDILVLFNDILDRLDLGIDEDFQVPFSDIGHLDRDSVNLLGVLNQYGIIQGEPGSRFSPDRELSQAEAVIILQRVKGVLDKLNNISFEVLGVVQSFNNQEEIVVTNDKDKVLITITKEFPTPGYSMEVNKIIRSKEGYKILVHVESPDPDMNVIQVITYQTITLEIIKDQLGNPPYNFILEGYNKIEDRVNI